MTTRVKADFEIAGWDEKPDAARTLDQLPVNARRYVERLAELCGVQVAMVGVGASRDATIVVKNPFQG